MRTRIKICGITRAVDAEAATRAGADAIGFVFYPPSPRCLTPEKARELRDVLPPFVGAVALFVNPTAAQVNAVVDRVRPSMLQFHGEEEAAFCAGFGLPWLKAVRVKSGVSSGGDLLKYLQPFSGAAGWLFDSHVEAYGGVGEAFDWSLIPSRTTRPVVLSGGLSPQNVREAVRRVRPWAVDVSSGVESAKGIKDAAKIAAFITEVSHADV
jgi:phosphoribosylanthranilate isomerase